MSAITTIPTSVQAKAAVHTAALGMSDALDQMLEHSRLTIPDARTIDVSLQFDPEGLDQPKIVLDVTRASPPTEYDPTQRDWNEWAIATFPPEVLRHFVMMIGYGAADER